LQTLKNNTDIFFLFFQVQNKLKHEEAFTRLNLAKINQQWRQILRQIKTKELKQDVEVNGIKLTV
jgi:L-rhamnose mutarotase